MSQVAEDTSYIRQRVDHLDEGLQRIHELLMGLTQGRRESLNNMFGASGSNDDDDHPDFAPPAYDTEQSPATSRESATQDRFRRAASMRWQLVPQDESSTLRVTTAEFLWRMAKVAADVHPWDNKIRSSGRYKDGTCDKALYNIVCHLMAISETRARWSTISIASWLTAGAWYLSLVRSFQSPWMRFDLANLHLGKIQACLWTTKQEPWISHRNICCVCKGLLDCAHYRSTYPEAAPPGCWPDLSGARTI
jgi:hypothetical protein